VGVRIDPADRPKIQETAEIFAVVKRVIVHADDVYTLQSSEKRQCNANSYSASKKHIKI